MKTKTSPTVPSRSRSVVAIALAAVLGGGAPLARSDAGSGEARVPPPQETTQAGVTVRFDLEPNSSEAGAGSVREGQGALARFKITDGGGTPLTALRPAVWMDLRSSASTTTPEQCHDKIQAFLQSSLTARPTVDLNTYFVLTLNDEPSISVLDPLRGFSTTKLLTLIHLPSPGEDWVLGRDGRRLFVSLPDTGQVAVVGTDTWKVVSTLGAGRRPLRVALQPDGRYLWVGQGAGGDPSVVVIDTLDLKEVARIPVGPGPHVFAFTPDDHFAFIAAREAGTVSVVEIRKLEKTRELRTGKQPSAIAFSSLSQAAYVAHEGEGGIVAIDGVTADIVARMPAPAGLVALEVAPTGRFGLALDRKGAAIHVFDVTTHALVHKVPVGPDSDQIGFTSDFAYVRSLGSDQVDQISLRSLGTREGPSVTHIPAGQAVPGAALRATGAAIVPSPEPRAVLIANPKDGIVYYYMEGMAAPMGQFSNYRRAPRAVLVADRSLKETAPGVYTVGFTPPQSGTFDMALLLDSPRVVYCFEANVEGDPERPRKAAGPAVRIEASVPKTPVAAGSSVRLRFKATTTETGAVTTGLKDLGVLALVAGGGWREKRLALPTEDGLYEVEVKPPRVGAYYVHWECPSQGLRLQDSFPAVFHVRAEARTDATKP